MAISRVSVQRAESVSAVGSRQTSAQAHNTGNLLVVLVSRQSFTGLTVTDTAGNTYRHVGSSYIWPSTNYMSIYICPNATGHASNQVTVALTSGTAAYFMVSVMEFSGNFGNNPAYFGAMFTWSSGVTMTNPWSSSAVNVGIIEADGQSITAGAGGATVGGFTSGYFADAYKAVSAAESFYGGASGFNECWSISLFETYQMQLKYSASYNTEDINSSNWVNPDAGTGAFDDTYYAYLNNQGDYLLLTNYGFSIPTGATIVGLTSGIYARAGAGGVQTGAQIIKGGTRTANWLSTSNLGTNAWFDFYTLGSAASVSAWGSLTLSVSDVNASNFGLALRQIAGASFMGIASADLTVFYTEAAGGTQPKIIGGKLTNGGILLGGALIR